MTKTAYPIVGEHGARVDNDEGASLRDYFAIRILQGMVPVITKAYSAEDLDRLCDGAYDLADRMMRAGGYES